MKTIAQVFVALSLLTMAAFPMSIGAPCPRQTPIRTVLQMADGPVPWPPGGHLNGVSQS